MQLERSPRATAKILNATAKTEHSRGKKRKHIPATSHSIGWLFFFFFNQKITSVVEDIENLAPLCAVGRNVKRHGQCGKRAGSSSEIKHKITK